MGYSAHSTAISILAAQIPGTPQAPTTTSIGQNIQITWSAPDDGGASITAYSIFIQQADGVSYSLSLQNCNGSSPAIVTSRTCLVPNIVLNTSPFNLVWGSSVNVKITVTNIIGTSTLSAIGGGAILVNGPSAPVNFVEVRTITTAYTIGLQWQQGTDNGGTPVIDYAIWCD